MITVDFETDPIERRPEYPPRPVGVAIKAPQLGDASRYLSWGSTKPGALVPFNPQRFAEGAELLDKVWKSGDDLLFHHAKFDLEVAEKHFGLPLPPWQRVHDTSFLAYLYDPHAPSLGLKELAANLLDWPADERDAMGDWVLANAKWLKPLNPGVPATKHKAAAWIWAMPPGLPDAYAAGDTDRTAALFEYLMPRVLDDGMLAPYVRERQLMPILLRNEQIGMRLDPIIIDHIRIFEPALERAEEAVRWLLDAPGLNLDADQQVAQALIRTGIVAEADFPRTEVKPNGRGGFSGGNLAMSKDDLRPDMFQGPKGQRVARALGYRNRLTTCLNTFMKPWAAQASLTGGYITTQWNQIRSPNGGTRTGRPSTSDHNFLNLPKGFDNKDDGYEFPVGLDVPDLPLCRGYVLPDPGEVFLHRDYNGQELRVFGQAEQGELHRQYIANPRIDPHAWVKGMMEPIAQRELPRRNVKVLNFQSLYGGGVNALQLKLRCTHAEAKELKALHDQALPGRKLVVDVIKRVVQAGLPIRTLGGRIFYPEKPGFDGRDKIYKLINYWVQGGAADLTKQAIIDWHDNPRKTARFLVTVYDEINASAPPHAVDEQMEVLRQDMERPRFGMQVAMLSDAKLGFNWAELAAYVDRLGE